MFRRIGLFLLLNMLVIMTIGILLSLFNVRPFITQYGIDYGQLLAFCFIWGIGGAFISLLLSRWMAKMMLRVQLITNEDNDPRRLRVRDAVHAMAQKAGMKTMPEVGIFVSDTPNAFATGPSPSHSLVAVSTGLLSKLSEDEVDAVLGHEISHITNGDMVTMTLLQGVVNAFVMFFARALALILSGFGRGDNKRGSWMMYYICTLLFEFVFFFLGFLVIAAYSRWREYRADKGGARLTTTSQMIHALQALEKKPNKEEKMPEALHAFMISEGGKRSFMSLFSTHPPIEARVKALQEGQSV